MRIKSGGTPTGLLLRLTAGAFLCLGVASPARPQAPPLSPQPAPTARPAIPADSPKTSQVFPEADFPVGGPTAEGAIPDTTAQPGPGGLYGPLPRTLDYTRP